MLDFAYHVHTDVGNYMIGAKVNGKYVTASHQLANSEIVDILTYDGPVTKNNIARHKVSCFCGSVGSNAMHIKLALATRSSLGL